MSYLYPGISCIQKLPIPKNFDGAGNLRVCCGLTPANN